MARRNLPFEHAQQGAPGQAFIEYMDELVCHDRQARQRQMALIHEWDYLTDHCGHRITADEYAEYWKIPRSTVYALLREFRALFPEQDDPTAICEEIWAGVQAQQGEDAMFFVDVERVRVIPSVATSRTGGSR
jgi:hypothetical protein